MFRIIFLGILFFVSIKISAQTISSDNIETNVQYFSSISKQDSLKFYYKLAKKHNILTNNMDIFVGEYYFKNKMFAKAIPYFEHAFSKDSYNIQLHYYLYVCYANMGMIGQQRLLATKFNAAQNEYYQIKKNNLENVSLIVGGLLSNNFTKNGTLNLTGADNYYGAIKRNGNLGFTYFSASYKLSNRVSLFGSFNSNTISGNQQFQYTSTNKKLTDTLFNYQVKQPVGFLQMAYVLDKSFSVKMSYSLTKTASTIVNPYSQHIVNNQFNTIGIVNTECTVGLIAEYRKPHVALATRFFVMPFSKQNYMPLLMRSDSDRMQLDISATYIPFQKNIFSMRAQLSYLNTQNSYAKYVYAFELNAKLTQKLWINTCAYFNNMKNFIDAEGAVVYNIDDIIKNKYAVKLLYYYGKHLELSAQYGLFNRSGHYTFITKENFNITKINTTYSNQLITGGIKWNF